MIALSLAAAVARGQDNAADAARLVELLRVVPGHILADIGAGPEALLTIPMAKTVGASGKVYATDLGDTLNGLRASIEKAGATNVEVVEGQPAATSLPAECCDGIFIRNVYHHFADPLAMNASLWRSLRPGGRLAVIDFMPRGKDATTAADRDDGDQHGVLPETVSRELQQAGFRFVASENQAGRWFMVVVEKPGR